MDTIGSSSTQEHANGNGATPAPHTGPVLRLCELDLRFDARGTVAVKVGDKYIELPIQSVDVEIVQAHSGKPPKPPMFLERRDGQTTRVRDLADQRYLDELERYNRDQMYVWICMAIAVDICTRQGAVVWSADNTTHDLVAAKEALKGMGLVDNQLIAIFNAARELTNSVQEVRQAD